MSFWGNSDEEKYFATGWSLFDSDPLTTGLFYWATSPPPGQWQEIHPANRHHNFAHFYRDISDPHKIYAIGDDGIWHSSATNYEASEWTEITAEFGATTPDDGFVSGFYQDDDYLYILIQNTSTGIWEICRWDQSDDGEVLATLDLSEEEDSWENFPSRANTQGLVVHKYQTIPAQYYIYVGTIPYGAVKHDTYDPPDEWTQMCAPGGEYVGGWMARSIMEDPMEAGAFFYGVWQGGMYHYSPSNGWDHTISGLFGGNGPGGHGGYWDAAENKFYGTSYQTGADEASVPAPPQTLGNYSTLGDGNEIRNEDASYAKCFNDIVRGPEEAATFYLGTRSYTQVDMDGSSDFKTGGLYKISSDQCSEVTGWDGYPNTDDKAWDVNRMVKDINGTDFYLATGELGRIFTQVVLSNGVINRHIVQHGRTSQGVTVFDNVATFTSDDEEADYAAPIALTPYPGNDDNTDLVIIGLGNIWDYSIGTSSYIGSVWGPVPTDNYSSSKNKLTGRSLFSVRDVKAIPNGTLTTQYVAWAATGKAYPANKAQVYLNDGGIYRFIITDTWQSTYDPTEDSPWLLYDPNRYGFPALQVFAIGAQKFMAAISCGLDNGYNYLSTFWMGRIDPVSYDIDWRYHETITIDTPEETAVPVMAGEIFGVQYSPRLIRFMIGGEAIHTLDKFFRVSTSSLDGVHWDWVSSNFYPYADSIKVIMATCDSLDEMRDQYHNRYDPNSNPPIDSIYVWHPLMAYSIKTVGSDEFENLGDPMPPDTDIVLYPAPQDSSWIYNFIAYLPTDTFNVNECFLADSDTVIIVKNDEGHFWKPGSGPKFDMVPGEGYQVGVSDTMTYNYPASQGNRIELPPGEKNPASGIASLEPSHFTFTEKTGDFYPIYIEDLLINGEGPAVGDEVGVFAPNDLCVGASVYEGEFPIEIAAWKDDPCTDEVDGYHPGETLSFKFFDVSAGVEVPLELTATGESYPPVSNNAYTRFEQGYYAEHHLQASYVLPGSYALLQNYPNPFNPATTIRYNLPFESNVKLEIFDLMGRKVITLVDGKQSAGFRAIHWEGKNTYGAELSSGVYFYRLKADATQVNMGKKEHYEKTHKMVLIK